MRAATTGALMGLAMLVVVLSSHPAPAEALVFGDPQSDGEIGTAALQITDARYQQLYEAEIFAPLGDHFVLTGLAFRADADPEIGGFGALSASYDDFEIRIGTTDTTAETFSTVFDDNIGSGGLTLVRDGAFTADVSGNTVSNGTAATFDIVLPFDVPFALPSGENILLEIIYRGGPGGAGPRLDTFTTSPDLGARVGATLGNASGGQVPTDNTVTRFDGFDAAPAIVPLPPAILLLVPTLAALGAIRRPIAR